MKILYQVRIDPKLRVRFINAMPWGTQGEAVEALLDMFLEKCKIEGSSLAVAKLTGGRYELKEKEPPNAA